MKSLPHRTSFLFDLQGITTQLTSSQLPAPIHPNGRSILKHERHSDTTRSLLPHHPIIPFRSSPGTHNTHAHHPLPRSNPVTKDCHVPIEQERHVPLLRWKLDAIACFGVGEVLFLFVVGLIDGNGWLVRGVRFNVGEG